MASVGYCSGEDERLSWWRQLCHQCPLVPQASNKDGFDLVEVICEMSVMMLVIHLSWNVYG